MTLLQIDPTAVRDLCAALRRGVDSSELSAESLRSALRLAELADAVPSRLDGRAEDWQTGATTLDSRATEAEAFELGLDPPVGGGLVTVKEYVGGGLGPTLDSVDPMIATLLEVEAGLAGLGATGGPVVDAMSAQRDALRRELSRLTLLTGDELDLVIVQRGLDLLTSEISDLQALPAPVAASLGLAALRDARNGMLDKLVTLMPAEYAGRFVEDIESGATMVEALLRFDPDAERAAGYTMAMAALRAHGGSPQEAYEAGAIGLDDLYHLEPIESRGPDFFVPLTMYRPEPDWYDGEVAHYWHILWAQQHTGMDPADRAAIAAARVAEMPGIPRDPIIEQDRGLHLSWREIGDFLLRALQWATSFVEGCLAVGGLAAPSAAVVAAYVSAAFFPVTGAAVIGAGCVAGGVAYAGVPGTDYDGIGPVGLP